MQEIDTLHRRHSIVVWQTPHGGRVERIDRSIANDGMGRDGRTEHQSVERLATAQRNVCLAVCERQTGIDDGMTERETLTLVYGYRPRRLYGILSEQSLAHLLYLFCLLIKLIAVVLPFFWRHLYGLVRALRLHHEATLVDGGDTPDHAVIIAFLWRRVVLHEHHLRIFLQLQHLVGGKRKFRKLALHHSLKHVCLSRQLLQLGVVYLLRHGVVGCETNVSLLLTRLEVGHIPTVKQAQHLCIGLVVAHLVEKVYEHPVALTIHMCEFHHRVVGLSQGMATEEIGCLIIARKHGPLLILCHRSQLSEVANEQKLHATERLVATAVMAQHAVNGIEQVGPDHTYLIDNNEVKTAHDLYLLLAKLKASALQHRRVRHIGGERQLEERVYGHTLSIDGSNACRCEHHVTF